MIPSAPSRPLDYRPREGEHRMLITPSGTPTRVAQRSTQRASRWIQRAINWSLEEAEDRLNRRRR